MALPSSWLISPTDSSGALFSHLHQHTGAQESSSSGENKANVQRETQLRDVKVKGNLKTKFEPLSPSLHRSQ